MDPFFQLKSLCIECLLLVENSKPNSQEYFQMLKPQGSDHQPGHWHTLVKDPFSLFCFVCIGHIHTLHAAGDLIIQQKVPVEGPRTLGAPWNCIADTPTGRRSCQEPVHGSKSGLLGTVPTSEWI